MDNAGRMAQLQAKGAGAPPEDPPMAPPGAEPAGDDASGMPPPEAVIPQISDALSQLAAGLPDDKKQLIMDAVSKLQAAYPANPSDSGGMPQADAEVYGEQPAV